MTLSFTGTWRDSVSLATLPTTKPTYTNRELNSCLSCKTPASNFLDHGAVPFRYSVVSQPANGARNSGNVSTYTPKILGLFIVLSNYIPIARNVVINF